MNTQILILLQKYISEQCDQQELEEVFAILKNGQYQTEWQKVIADEADQVLSSGLQSDLTQNEIDTIYSGIAAQLPSSKKIKHKLWPLIATAAVIFMSISAGLVFYFNDIKKHTVLEFFYTADIAPGKVGATLTLANGQKINLTNAAKGELVEQSGVTITKSADGQLVYKIKEETDQAGQLNTLSTAKGETYKVRLPDGSLIWLNAASSLTFSSRLNDDGKRRVKLAGEGYFEVAKDKDHPFIVESFDQEVEVLGTHFNISAYADEDIIKTTLIEGSVKVSSQHLQKLLSPGFEALKSGNDIQVHSVDAEQAAAWKDGKLVFHNIKIGAIMKMIERWYNVEVAYEGEMPEDLFLGSVSRFDNVSQVLNILESTGRIHFEVKGRKIYVSK